jgi:Protein of unknown function (DUF2971)
LNAQAQIIRATRGEWFFHYTTLERAIEHILPSLRMKLNPFISMRDPREYGAWVPSVGGWGELTDIEMSRGQAEAAQGLAALKNQFKLLSFTQDDAESAAPDEYGRGYARSHLWERYSSVGRGVCLVLRKDEAITEIASLLKRLGLEHHGPVAYRNQRLSTEIFFELEPILAGRYAEAEEAKLGQYMEDLFFTKNVEWSSEREYRFVVRTEDAAPVFVAVAQSLQGVCLGPETPKQYYPALHELCTAAGIATTKLIWWNNDPILVNIDLARGSLSATP